MVWVILGLIILFAACTASYGLGRMVKKKELEQIEEAAKEDLIKQTLTDLFETLSKENNN